MYIITDAIRFKVLRVITLATNRELGKGVASPISKVRHCFRRLPRALGAGGFSSTKKRRLAVEHEARNVSPRRIRTRIMPRNQLKRKAAYTSGGLGTAGRILQDRNIALGQRPETVISRGASLILSNNYNITEGLLVA